MSHHTSDSLCPACEEKLATVHADLSAWYHSSVKPAHPDCHVSWGYRDQASQESMFEDGATKLHFPDSAHNKIPARAIDLFQITSGGQAIWAPEFFVSVKSLAPSNIIWGGVWKTIGDGDHFELLIDPKQRMK